MKIEKNFWKRFLTKQKKRTVRAFKSLNKHMTFEIYLAVWDRNNSLIPISFTFNSTHATQS